LDRNQLSTEDFDSKGRTESLPFNSNIQPRFTVFVISDLVGSVIILSKNWRLFGKKPSLFTGEILAA
jgi:hypothetical protein